MAAEWFWHTKYRYGVLFFLRGSAFAELQIAWSSVFISHRFTKNLVLIWIIFPADLCRNDPFTFFLTIEIYKILIFGGVSLDVFFINSSATVPFRNFAARYCSFLYRKGIVFRSALFFSPAGSFF